MIDDVSVKDNLYMTTPPLAELLEEEKTSLQ